MTERTLVLIKPDGVKRGLIGRIIQRFEDAGLKIVAMKMVWIDKDLAERHYEAHKGKPFFETLVKYITEGPVVAMVLEGVDAVNVVRKIVGPTDPREAPPGTIRGDFAHVAMTVADEKRRGLPNIIHASGSKEEAEKEIYLWFSVDEIHSYKRFDEYYTMLE